MSTIFTLNPIKLNLISINNKIKQTVVFIGIVPKDVKEELLKIEAKNHNKKIINLKDQNIYDFELFSPKKLHTALCERPIIVDYEIICSGIKITSNNSNPSCLFLIPSHNILNSKLRV